MVARALAIPRGCGTRKAGGVYAECGMSGHGRPVEYFLICPPWKLVPEALEALGVRPIGVTPLEREGVTHVVDWVGSEHYRNVADFVEEVRVGGLSRRIPRTFDFSVLTPASRMLMLHARAWVQHTPDYYAALKRDFAPGNPYAWAWVRTCPKGIAEHNVLDEPPTMCCQLYWQDVEGGEPDATTTAGSGRFVVRSMPAFHYRALQPPAEVERLYCPAIFASFPISRLAVIRDPEGGSHEQALEIAQKANIVVELEDA